MTLFGAGAYYNEIDPYAAAWLRNLIAAGHIAPGDVDTRSILDVSPDDLRGYTQCHFFAGLGGWSLALRRAGWGDERPIWTGSCPCQPFSVAGVGAGFDDERHVWPFFQHLIRVCGPSVVAGEQVASKNADTWIDLVQADLETLGYAVGAIAFPSAGVGAPHIRDRAYWAGIRLADADSGARGQGRADVRGRPAGGDAQSGAGLGGGGVPDRLDDANNKGLEGLGRGHQAEVGRLGTVRPVAATGESGGMADARYNDDAGEKQAASVGQSKADRSSDQPSGCGVSPGARPGPTNGLWRDADWLGCRDGRWRPVEPGTFPLAHGAAPRVGRLRAYGNAINIGAAQAFIESLMECMP